MKNYLLDTHTLLWIVCDPTQLSEQVKNIFLDESNSLFFSYMSLWEVSIKLSIGKLKMEVSIEMLIETLESKGLVMVMPTVEDTIFISKMPFHKKQGIEHRDPFDRILIAQSESLEMEIISIDEKFDLYEGIQRIW